MQGGGITIVYSPSCPNCKRFIEGFQRTTAAGTARMMDVYELPPAQLAHVKMVPCVFVGGGAHQGTHAFEWLRQLDSAPPDSFAGFDDGFTSFDGTADAETLHAASRGYGLF